jgi:hypothetical protein
MVFGNEDKSKRQWRIAFLEFNRPHMRKALGCHHAAISGWLLLQSARLLLKI